MTLPNERPPPTIVLESFCPRAIRQNPCPCCRQSWPPLLVAGEPWWAVGGSSSEPKHAATSATAAGTAAATVMYAATAAAAAADACKISSSLPCHTQGGQAALEGAPRERERRGAVAW